MSRLADPSPQSAAEPVRASNRGSTDRKSRRARWLWVLCALGTLSIAAALPILWIAWQRAELESPASSLLLTDRNGRYIADIGGVAAGDHGYWPLDTVPERIAAATLALEDGRFHRHHGVDLLAVARASWQNLSCGCVRSGASTIAMQLVRLQRPQPRTLANKAMEALSAWMLTLRHGREDVLRHYLQRVPYGNGSHGIAHAARWYLDKPAEDLSWAEIALLSALPHAPDRLNPLRRDGRSAALARARRILDALRGAEVIDPVDLDLAQRQLDALVLRARPRRPDSALHAILELERQLSNGEVRHGVRPSTLDLPSQELAFRHTLDWLDRYRHDGVQHAAVLVVDRRDMAVRALIGSADYFADQGGAQDFSTIRRSPGSVLKPLIYALALDRGVIAPDTLLWDQAEQADGVRNADRQFLGAMLPRQALANSRNVPAVALVHQLGLEHSFAFLASSGLHQHEHSAEHHGAGLAIGTLPVTLRDVVAAFGMLVNDGRRRPLRWWLSDEPAAGQQLLHADSARLISQFLSDPMVRLPSFVRMGALEYPFPVAVKTGTSQDLRDAWTLAYSDDYIVGAWAGRADHGSMHDSLRGSTVAELVREVLIGVHRLPGASRRIAGFASPSSYRQQAVCLATGQRDRGNCAQVVDEWLPRSRSAVPDHHRLAPLPASGQTVDTTVSLRIDGPRHGSVYHRNPETPADLNIIRLRVRAEPLPEQVVWHVNGRPQAVLAAEQSFDWPMLSGRYVFHVELPYRPERSPDLVLSVL